MIHPLMAIFHELREEQNLSQAKVANKINALRGEFQPKLKGSHIGKMERGLWRPTLPLFEEMLNALGYELEIVKK